jgi:hypothetical protein
VVVVVAVVADSRDRTSEEVPSKEAVAVVVAASRVNRASRANRVAEAICLTE